MIRTVPGSVPHAFREMLSIGWFPCPDGLDADDRILVEAERMTNRVHAWNAAGDSAPSNVVEVTTPQTETELPADKE